MKRFGRALAKKITYANVVATLALLFAMGGTAAAAVIISSNAQVAGNTISGHAVATGKHANIISGSVNGSDLAPSVGSAFRVHCPNGLQLGGDLCFDPSPRAAATWGTALDNCANAGLRLATPGELRQIFDHSSAVQVEQWTDTVYFANTFLATELDQSSSRQTGIGASAISATNQYRCVATPTN